MNIKIGLLLFILSIGFIHSAYASQKHPLDGITHEEFNAIVKILRKNNIATEKTLFPLIELIEPDKQFVKQWKAGEDFPRKVVAHLTSQNGFMKVIIDIANSKVERVEKVKGQPMVLFTEFINAMETALSSPKMIAGLKKRKLTPDDVFCLPLTAGNFFTKAEKNKRLMKVPCYVNPTGSNFYAKPIEGLYATIDLQDDIVLEVIDEGVVPIPQDPWGYTAEEVAKKTSLRKKGNPPQLTHSGKPNYVLDGSKVRWDMWEFRYRVDKRPGLVISEINANDQGNWRSVLYQAHLSEVFVPYQDPSSGWYWRTYMDSGEYGFGLFLSPLAKGVDCPDYSTFLPALVHDDAGAPLEIPDAICIFERATGDPAWRHFEIFAQDPENGVFVPSEGRPETELVIRTASQVGNYDYLIDYRFKQTGDIYIKIGATGLDAVKGVASRSLDDATAKKDTKYGNLIAPHLVAPNHNHFFNFKLDFDIDQANNTGIKTQLVAAQSKGARKSLWEVKNTLITKETEGTLTLSSQKPAHLMIMNTNRKGYLGYHPAWMVHHVSVAGAMFFDFEQDPPMKRNAYIKYQIWNTLYNKNHRYAGGEYALASDGSDTLDKWIQTDSNLENKDVVTWVTAGFHHIARMEDWPVMKTEWKTIHIQPMNFFAHNPALTIR